MTRFARRMLPLLCLLLGTVCAHAAKPEPGDTPLRLRVLFVGNSYLYTNNLPEVVAAVAAAQGVELVPGMLAEPNYAIEDHLATDAYVAMLDRGWDWVVLQQGPSSLPVNQANLRFFSGRAANEARARGIRVALMSAWPAWQNAHTWEDAEMSYRNAAIANNLCVLPVATSWRLALAAQPTVDLYQSDQLHPERDGTLLAALVLAQGLIDLPRTDPPQVDAWLDDNWRRAAAHTALLNGFARTALATEGPRCSWLKRRPR